MDLKSYGMRAKRGGQNRNTQKLKKLINKKRKTKIKKEKKKLGLRGAHYATRVH
jgi:hypothetical protein